jgi:hypothetical protein
VSDARTDDSGRRRDEPGAESSHGHRAVLGPWVAVALSLVLATAYHVGALAPGERPLLNLDDGYIHARLAENLVGTGVLGINPGDGGGGSSSLLWTLLVGAGVALGLPGDLAAGLLSLCGLALAVGIASRLCFDLLPPAPAWVASIAVALSGQTVALGLSGMESLLFAGLVIAGLRDAMLGRRWNGTLLFSLAACVRAEAVLAALAFFAVLLALRGRQVGLPRPARGLMQLLVVVATAAIAVLALAALGQGMPATLAARRWLYGMGETILPGPEQWTGAIPLLLEDLWLRLSIAQGPGHFVGHAWALVVVVLAAAGLLASFRIRQRAVLPLYFILQMVFVVLVLGSDSHLSRYLAPLWIMAPLVVTEGWRAIVRRIPSRRVTIPILVLLLALCLPQAINWAGWHRRSTEHLRDVHLAMTHRIAEAVPADEAVAAFDIGLLSYMGDRRIVDMGGMTDPEMIRAMRRSDVPRLLADRDVRYAVFPEADHPGPRYVYVTRLGFDPGRLGAPLARTAVRVTDLGYLSATKVAMPALALYELRREVKPASGR